MDRMSRALSEYMITGIKTTIPFEQAILQDPDFRARRVFHQFHLRQLPPQSDRSSAMRWRLRPDPTSSQKSARVPNPRHG
jgi:pyruvate carboxylase